MFLFTANQEISRHNVLRLLSCHRSSVTLRQASREEQVLASVIIISKNKIKFLAKMGKSNTPSESTPKQNLPTPRPSFILQTVDGSELQLNLVSA